MDRLHPDMLARARPAVDRPHYDRDALRIGIVHLGLGAFARAHLAPVNEAAMVQASDWRWGICGVSLRQPDTRDALAPQDGLYTLAIRDADAAGAKREQLSIIGTLREALVAPDDPTRVLARIAAPDTRIVSLTVTEKGYCHHPATGALNADHPDIVHDLLHPESPRSIVGFIVYGLQQRHAAKASPLALMSLDNLPSNGKLLRGLVLDFAGRVDPGLQEWIATTCTFPCSMVDRIVPRTTEADRESISRAIGLVDAWPVLGEPFLDWVIEDDFAAGRPEWSAAGARFVTDATPYEVLKLRMVNGTHSALAYLSVLAGWRTVDQAIAEPAMRRYISTLMRDEITPTLPALEGLDLAQYAQRLLARFANPALQHQTRQIAMDGSQKLPQRLLGTIRERLRDGMPIDGLALAVAAWLVYLQGRDEAREPYAISDPLADALKVEVAAAVAAGEAATNSAHRDVAEVADMPYVARTADFADAADEAYVAQLTGYRPVFGDLGSNDRFVKAVAAQVKQLRTIGVAATLATRGTASVV